MKARSWSILIALSCFTGTALGGAVRLRIDAPTAEPHETLPLYCGVPFPRGTLKGLDSVRVTDAASNTVSSQARVMAFWPGSDDIRWLGVDFIGNPSNHYYLAFNEKMKFQRSTGQTKIEINKHSDGWDIVTGPARFLIGINGPLISKGWINASGDANFTENDLVITNCGRLYLIDQHGRKAHGGVDLEPDSFTLEPRDGATQKGELLHLTVRREGWYTIAETGERLARHITRMHFYAGESFLRIEHTLVLTRFTAPVPQARGSEPIWFKEIGIKFNHSLANAGKFFFGSDHSDAKQTYTGVIERGQSAFMFQGKAFFMDRMDSNTDCEFIIGKENRDNAVETLMTGQRCGDWVETRNQLAGISLGIRDLWQQYPKELVVESDSLTALLWSDRGGRELDFRMATLQRQWPATWLDQQISTPRGKEAYGFLSKWEAKNHALGLAKSHELILDMHVAPENGATAAIRALSRPATVLADPAWLYRGEAMSPLYPKDDNFPLAEAYMLTYFKQYKAVMKDWGDYGFLDYGARPHIFYQKGKTGSSHAGRWRPLLYRYSPLIDYGFSSHLWRMYARSGIRDYLELAETTSRHRMDICMFHWDSPDVDYNRIVGMLDGKYKGGFSDSKELIPWSPNTILHHQSGTELRQLYWHYYLRDYRRAHDVAEEYRSLVKRLWASGSRAPFTSTRPFATLKMLATLYHETGDPEILSIGRERLEDLVDLSSPQGVSPDKEATAMGKYTTKLGAIERWYEATGDELAGQALMRGATTYARTSLGNPGDGYYNVFGRVLNRAYRISGDPLFARVLKRDMRLTIERNYNPASGAWGNTLSKLKTVSASDSAYPLGDMVLAMDAIKRAGEIGSVPLACQQSWGRPVLALIRKKVDQEVTLDIRSPEPIFPKVHTLDGHPVKQAIVEPFLDQLYSLESNPSPKSFLIRLPAALAAGDYLLDVGAGGAPWEIFQADAPGLVIYAPGGISLENGREWYLRIPPDTRRFSLREPSKNHLFLPGGDQVQIEGSGIWEDVFVPRGKDDSFWHWRPNSDSTLFSIAGIPPLFLCDTNRWFMPDIGRIPLEQFGLRSDYRHNDLSSIFPDDNPLFTSDYNAAIQGIAFNGRRILKVPSGLTASLSRSREGTIELWLCPDWSSVDGARNKYMITGGGWSLVLNRQVPESPRTRPHNATLINQGSFSVRSSLTLERGDWVHLAWQWSRDSENSHKADFFVNGQRQHSVVVSSPQPKDDTDGSSTRDEPMLIGHHFQRLPRYGSLTAVVADLRFSDNMRYDGNFTPTANLVGDSHTLALFKFNGDTTGISSTDESIMAEFLP